MGSSEIPLSKLAHRLSPVRLANGIVQSVPCDQNATPQDVSLIRLPSLSIEEDDLPAVRDVLALGLLDQWR